MKHIESRANPVYKQLFKWQSSAGRRDEPVLLEGVHLCESWLELGRQPKYAIFDLDRIGQAHITALIDKLNPDVCLSMSGSLLGHLSSVDTDQGVLFVVQPTIHPVPEKIIETIVMLDRLQDPGNVGALLRTSAAAGIKRVFASTGTAGLWSPKVLRSAQGAHFVLKLHEHVDLHALTEALAVPLIVTTLSDATDLYRTKLPINAAWVFGNEGQGVAETLLNRADMRVKIMHDKAVESLNVTVASAICLFEQRRQHQSAR
jgi:TrmH family RNA methyltransferase